MFTQISTWIILAYFLGAIPFALIIGLVNGSDIRLHGSGNVGATNCGRVVGKKWGFLCFFLDVCKGFLPVFLAGHFCQLIGADTLTTQQAILWLLVGIMTVLGHVFPIYLKFKGGKGVATSTGMLLGFYPLLTIPVAIVFVIWIILTAIWKMIGLSSSVVAILLPLVFLGFLKYKKLDFSANLPFISMTLIIGALVLYMHRSNIGRIIAGTEPKLGSKK